MQKILILQKIFQKYWAQCILLFLSFLILASIFINIHPSQMSNSLPNHIDAYLISWIWSWENHILTTDPLNFFNANLFAPFENTLAYTETMLGTFLLAWPILIIFNNVFLAYNIVILLTFGISGLGMYLLIYYLTKNKLAAVLSALIYAFAPFKLIHSIGHLHITGMWLPYVFLYLHKFFKKQSWKNTLLLSLFVILVFLTGFHYFVFLPVVIVIFLSVNYEVKNFKFNKNNIKKIILALILSSLIIIPIVLPYIYLKEKYNFFRSIETVEVYSPDLINYFIPPFLYNYFYANSSHIEMVVSPGIVIFLIFIFSLYYIFKKIKQLKLTHQIHQDQINFIIYFIISLIAFIISFGFYIQFKRDDVTGLPTFYSLFYAFIPGFNGIRAAGRYSIFILLSIAVFVGYGFNYFLRQESNVFKKIIIYFLIIFFLFIELSFVPSVKFTKIKMDPQIIKLSAWLKKQPSDNIFLNLPMGFRNDPFTNLDILYVFNSRLHFRKIVNGYSGYYPPGYLQLAQASRFFKAAQIMPWLEKFKVNYVIFHWARYPTETKKGLMQNLQQNDKIKYIANFGENYVYEVIYD